MEQLFALDGMTLIWIQDHLRTGLLTPFFLFITRMGNLGMIWMIASLVFLCFRKTRTAGMAGILALMMSLFFNNYILKNLVQRVRPYEVVEGLQLLTKKATDFSFPSGHSGSSFAAATAFSCMNGRKIGIPAVCLAVLIAFSRLYIGIHYPTDVLAGICSGICCGLAAVYLIRQAVKWKKGV